MNVVFVLALACCSGTSRDEELLRAAGAGQIDAIRTHVKQGATVNARTGPNGWTPLLQAIQKGELDAVRTLLDLGADPNATSTDGTTPLMLAAGYGNLAALEVLVSKGGNLRLRNRLGDSAIDYAMAGVMDLDAWSGASCQESAVRTIFKLAPDLKPRPATLKGLQGCTELASLWGGIGVQP